MAQALISMHLPGLSPEDFDESFRLEPKLWREAIVELCREHGVSTRPFVTFTQGSNLVAAVGGQVVKVFPPFHRHQWQSEYRVLAHLANRLTFPVPQLIAHGERPDGWTYAILSLLAGNTLEGTWPGLSPGEKVDILRDVGSAMAEVHRVPVGALSDLPPSWKQFLRVQSQGCLARHRRLGAPGWLLEELPAYLEQHATLLSVESEPVILTGEYTPFNLMAEQTPDGMRLTGMIDFGDAMLGPAEYDLLGPSAFLCGGEAALFHALLKGYGIDPSALAEGLRTRLMLLMLLHRHSHLRVQLRVPEWSRRAQSIAELARLIFPD